jgi:hypothetical protein
VRRHGSIPSTSRAVARCALLVLVAWCAACGREVPAAVVPPPATDIEWREVGSWSGRSGRQTESFEVSLTALRLRWKTTRETAPGAGRFTVTVHSAVSGRPIQTLVQARGVGADTVNVADEPRWSHFVVDAVDVEWEMTLEQGYERPAR